MKQTIEIEVPYGKRAIFKDNKIVYEDINPQLPKTWEEFCEQNKVKKSEYFINNSSYIANVWTDVSNERHKNYGRNILPNKKAAKAHLALMQLHQLRDCYRQGWMPNLTIPKSNFAIFYMKGKYSVEEFMYSSEFLSFQSKEIAQEFLNNFRDLIEQAGDLI